MKHKNHKIDIKPDSSSESMMQHLLTFPSDSANSLVEYIPWYYFKTAVVSCSCVALFLDMLSYSIIIPILPEYLTEVYHLSSDYLGILFGSYAFGLLISTPVFGFFSDHYQSTKPFMILGYIGQILSSLFFMYGSTFTHLLIHQM